jgi:polysaccharide export outer membrane protein
MLAMLFIHSALFSAESSMQEYVIGPGDKLNIQVWGHPDLDCNVEVSGSGDFSFPLIGKVHSGGMSVFDLEKQLVQKLTDGYLVSPHVRVGIVEYKNQKVYLFGAVQKPGSYAIKGKTTILELISSMGGITDETGSVAFIVRPESEKRKNKPLPIDQARANEIIIIDLHLGAGEVADNIFVLPGDSIYVNKAKKIFVIGEVKNPGNFKWEKNLTVRKAISLAGGPSPTGSSKRTQIIRIKNGKEIKIRPKMSDPVDPEDIIKIPRSYF